MSDTPAKLRRPLLMEAVNLIDPLFSDDQVAALGSMLEASPLSPRVAPFADYLPEAKAACDFLPKLATIQHPSVPDPQAVIPPLGQ